MPAAVTLRFVVLDPVPDRAAADALFLQAMLGLAQATGLADRFPTSVDALEEPIIVQAADLQPLLVATGAAAAIPHAVQLYAHVRRVDLPAGYGWDLLLALQPAGPEWVNGWEPDIAPLGHVISGLWRSGQLLTQSAAPAVLAEYPDADEYGLYYPAGATPPRVGLLAAEPAYARHRFA